MSGASLATNSVRRHLEVFSWTRRVAFAAFWAQRSWPFYERLSQRSSFGAPSEVQRCLDIAWRAVEGSHSVRSVIHAALHQLERLTPELDTYPLLGFAGLQCTTAASDAIELSDRDDIRLAIRPWHSFQSIIEHYLGWRDYAGLATTTREWPPAEMRQDPIWNNNQHSLNVLLETLGSPDVNDMDLVARLRESAMDALTKTLVDEMDRLASRTAPPV